MKPLVLGAAVECSDGRGGKVKAVVVDPAANAVSMLVVETAEGFSHRACLVPVAKVTAATRERVELALDRSLLAAMDPYVVDRYVPTALRDGILSSPSGLSTTFPSLVTERVEDKIEDALTPPGHVVFHAGCEVYAEDGKAGTVAGFVVDDDGADIVQVLVEHGHLWHRSRASIGADRVRAFEGDTILLSMSRNELEHVAVD